MRERTETDSLGSLTVPADALYGIHTVRALANFPLSGQPCHSGLIRGMAQVKLACARQRRALRGMAMARKMSCPQA